MRFSELNLEPSLFSAIQKLKFEECTPIQQQAMAPVLEGRDVAGLAQTGTGKTAAFLVPLMDRILKARLNTESFDQAQKEAHAKRSFLDWRANNFILILVPTRELAEQVQANITQLSVDSGLRGFAIYGGTAYDKQKEAVKTGLDFVVATPGRLIDLYKEHVVDLKQVRAVVFDEADRMFDMGFKDDMKYILQRIPTERQFLVFSATLNFDVLNTAYQFGADPVEINVSLDQSKAENVKDELFHVGTEDKLMYLLSLLKKYSPKQAIIFSNFKFSVERIARFLSDNGVPAMGISSLLTQAQRTRVMEQFKAENEKNILVATDVAARGLDIKGVDLVINFELPMDAESYVHRIGRTGRAGAEGRAFSLASEKDVESLSRIEDYLKHKIEIGWMEDSELVRDFKPMARSNDYGDQSGGRSEGRNFDRGPRSSSGGGSSGGRPPRGASRGPQGRDERGPRSEGRRPHGDRPARSPSRDQARDQHGQEKRTDQRSERSDSRSPRTDRSAGSTRSPDNRTSRPDSRGAHSKHQPRHERGDRSEHRSAGASAKKRPLRPGEKHRQVKPPVAKSMTQKVSRFFKKIFGS